MIDLYTYGTGNGWRASIALEECELPYRAHKIDIATGAQNAPDYRAINPAGKIPAIIDSDGPGGVPITITDSGAILLYCAEKTGRFMPRDPAERIAALRWVFHSVSDAGEPLAGLFRLRQVSETPEAVFNFLRKRLSTVLKDANSHLEGRTWLVGDAISVADLAFFTVVALGKMFVGLDGLTDLERWHNAMAARPGVARGMAVPG